MLFLANQVMKYFHVFILLLIAICLAAVCTIASHHGTPASSIRPVRYHLYGHVNCVPQQLSSRQNGEFRGYRVESSLSSLVLSLVYSTIITNALINQVGSYYICNYQFYLIWDRSHLYPVTYMILLLHLTSALL